MISLDDCIMDYLNKRWISPEEAFIKSIDKSRFLPFIQNREVVDFTEMPG